MNSKTKTIILIIALIAVLVISYFAYKNLSAKPDVTSTTAATTTQSTSDTSDTQSTSGTDETSITAQSSTEQTTAAVIKNTAPGFTVYDADGNAVSLSSFFGKPIVINFWASWCGPCKSEMPSFEEVYKQYGNEVEFLMVNLTTSSYETLAGAKAYIASQGFTFPVYYDKNGKAASAYSTYSIPVTVFIDKNGNVVKKLVGSQSKSVIAANTELLTYD